MVIIILKKQASTYVDIIIGDVPTAKLLYLTMLVVKYICPVDLS